MRYIINPKQVLSSFYNNEKVNFKDISKDKLNEIIERAKELNEIYNSNFFSKTKVQRYLKLMEKININYRKDHYVNNMFASASTSEKFLLFMFSVDPNFDAAIIYGIEDRIPEAKKKITEKLGIYDINLIRIEKFVIEHLIDKEKKEEINNEIDKRAFK